MANQFSVISKKFYNQYRNGDTFASNLTEFTDRLQGNVGELVQLVEEIEVRTIANEGQSIDIQFFELSFLTYCTFSAPLLDWVEEGFYNGAGVRIEFDGTFVNGTCEGVSGSGNSILKLDSTTRTALLTAGLTNEETRQDIVIKITTAPTYLNYKAGINPNGTTSPNYDSPYGGETSFQLKGITGAFQDMLWVGNLDGSNLGSARVKFDGTNDNYRHTFTVEHTFKMPYYIEGQTTNINTGVNPSNLLGANSVNYGNGFFFGGTTNITVAQFEDLGSIGNVGYFNENFNGFVNNYDIENVVYTNTPNTGTLESTLTTTVTFDIKNNLGSWSGGEEVILNHSKLPLSTEYTDQTDDYDDIWVFDSLRQTEGAAAVFGDILKNFTATIDGGDPTLINVSCNFVFSSDDQARITEESDFLIYLTVATQNLSTPDTMDRVNLIVDQKNYSADVDVKGLVTNYTPEHYEEWTALSGAKNHTNFTGWDGDLVGLKFDFDVSVAQGGFIKEFKAHVVIDDGTNWHSLWSQAIAITKIAFFTNTYDYQIFDKDLQAGFNFPSTEPLNRLKLTAEQPVGTPTVQNWKGEVSFRVPWRDWIENLNIPTTFIDYSEPNNNLNEKTSNYSGVSGYDVKSMLEVLVGSSEGPDTTYLLF